MRRRGVGRGRPSLVGTAARTAVIAGTATAVSGSVAHGQQAKAQQAAAQEQAAAQQQAAADAAAAQAAAQAAPPAGLTDDGIAQLKQLAELKDAGILTDEEFAAKKAQLLGL